MARQAFVSLSGHLCLVMLLPDSLLDTMIP